MPRVSQRHLDARRQHILDAARTCFVRNGFHATSMQDILGEADVSTGAVYRYFKSKDDIISAIVQDVLAVLSVAFEETLAEDGPPPPIHEVFLHILSTIERIDRTQDVCKLAVQVWGEAQREPALVGRVAEASAIARTFLTRIVELHQAHGTLPRDVPADRITRVLMAIVPGFIVQRALLGDVNAVMFHDGLRALLSSDIITVPDFTGHC